MSFGYWLTVLSSALLGDDEGIAVNSDDLFPRHAAALLLAVHRSTKLAGPHINATTFPPSQ